jgi:hypothetical protein
MYFKICSSVLLVVYVTGCIISTFRRVLTILRMIIMGFLDLQEECFLIDGRMVETVIFVAYELCSS